jgi:hypothetical protein
LISCQNPDVIQTKDISLKSELRVERGVLLTSLEEE